MTAQKQQTGDHVIALLVIATAQLMLVLDDSIVNIALPDIQDELGITPVHLPWVVNAYILAFGALLLLGGRIGDLWGRKRTLQVGLVLFVAASLAGGFAQDTMMLIVARAVQGVGAALTAPNALARIATTFDTRKMRDTALSLYGAMSGLGIVIGLLLGGVLTELLDWRWVFFINVPIGLLVVAGTRTLIAGERHTGRLGGFGAALGTGGMVALVYAVTRFGEEGLSDPLAHGLLAAGALLMVIFVFTQRGSSQPLLPLSLFADRNRWGAYLAMLGLAIGPMGTFYIITLYMQHVLGQGPLLTGLSWLPFALGIVVGAGLGPKLLTRIAPRQVAALGALLSAAGVFWLSRITLETQYWTAIAPGMLIVAIGFGTGVMTLTHAAVYGVDADKAGIASALLNSSQQIGVALGLAILASIAARVGTGVEAGGASTDEVLIAGYQNALMAGSGVLVAAAVLALLTLSRRSPTGQNS
ncbi:MFS transporter [Microbacterium sp.]|uniref:MFS transporter n=1 Tax=Microbacterium sp. TaxID=51671 RepID=UPI002811C6D9|nr:MFS transporter [Microbacterium sp.]